MATYNSAVYLGWRRECVGPHEEGPRLSEILIIEVHCAQRLCRRERPVRGGRGDGPTGHREITEEDAWTGAALDD